MCSRKFGVEIEVLRGSWSILSVGSSAVCMSCSQLFVLNTVTDCVSAMDGSSVALAHPFGIITVGEARGHHRTALQRLITLAKYKTRRHNHPAPVALVVLKTDCECHGRV